jgi:hypothetical protein
VIGSPHLDRGAFLHRRSGFVDALSIYKHSTGKYVRLRTRTRGCQRAREEDQIQSLFGHANAPVPAPMDVRFLAVMPALAASTINLLGAGWPLG